MSRISCYLSMVFILILQLGCVSSDGSTDDPDDVTGDNSTEDTSTDGTGNDSDNGDNVNNPDNTDSTDHTVSLLGMVGILQGKTGGSTGSVVTASADFFEYENSFVMQASSSNPFDALVGSCEVSTDGSSDFGEIPEPGLDVNTQRARIDAGTGIKITSAGSDYLDLITIRLGEDSVLYASIEDSDPMAPDLKLTIPGDGQFPSFTDVPMTTLEPLVFSSPANNTIRFDTQFTWQAGTNPDVLVLLSATAFNTTVECFTEDSGSFEFPEDTQNELGMGFFGNKLTATRLSYDVAYKDEAALVVFSMSVVD